MRSKRTSTVFLLALAEARWQCKDCSNPALRGVLKAPDDDLSKDGYRHSSATRPDAFTVHSKNSLHIAIWASVQLDGGKAALLVARVSCTRYKKPQALLKKKFATTVPLSQRHIRCLAVPNWAADDTAFKRDKKKYLEVLMRLLAEKIPLKGGVHGWISVILGRQDWPMNTPARDADDEEHANDPHPMDNYGDHQIEALCRNYKEFMRRKWPAVWDEHLDYLVYLLKICLKVPLDTSCCERWFSLMNRLKSK